MRRKKNWNIIRRLILLSAFSLLLSTFICCDKEEMLYGSWNLQTVLKNGEPLNDSLAFNLIPNYTYYTFFYANILTVDTYAKGQPASSSNGSYRFIDKSTLELRFTIFYINYNFHARIKKLTQRELHLEYDDNGNTYLMKLYTNR